jgi:DNA-binding transcriptional regulator WhiA
MTILFRPEFGLKESSEIKYRPIPVWIQHSAIQKRGILETVKNFLQLVVSGQLPLIVSGSLSKIQMLIYTSLKFLFILKVLIKLHVQTNVKVRDQLKAQFKAG